MIYRCYFRPVDTKAAGMLLPVPLQLVYLETKYRDDQPRVPRGNPAGGQWTDDPAHGGDGIPSRTLSRIINHGEGRVTVIGRDGARQDINDPPLQSVYPFETVMIPAARRMQRVVRITAQGARAITNATAERIRRQLGLRGQAQPQRPLKRPKPLARNAERRVSVQRQERLAEKELERSGFRDPERMKALRLGDHKSSATWRNQLEKGGWTPEEINRVKDSGQTSIVGDNFGTNRILRQYFDRNTGKYFVEDPAKGEIIHISRPGYRPYDPL